MRTPRQIPDSGACQFARPARIGRLAFDEGRSTERVHPLGQIVEVLAVPIPLQTLVEWLGITALPESLADSQPARGRVAAPFSRQTR